MKISATKSGPGNKPKIPATKVSVLATKLVKPATKNEISTTKNGTGNKTKIPATKVSVLATKLVKPATK
ncbi:hypothetical protein [Bacillus sp. V59.32b]|uniref:hypothetical protein n=1 Tax=Bacillus sp. V59.32b TaxID=1758642 RepID=UPI000E3BB42A|nr:hypothetical protein [Bacillus sp. V59.32b]RFU61517.1 hypothetical protein D0463_14815 [Bacillus sp. V59.32b]